MVLSPPVARRKTLRPVVLHRSGSVLEQALAKTPDALCPPDLYHELLDINEKFGGRTVLLERAGDPAAVIGVRRIGRVRWQNAMNWLIPGFVAAARTNDDLLPAFAAIRSEIAIAWWRMPVESDPTNTLEISTEPTYQLPVADREEYWRSGSMWRRLTRDRRKCEGLTITVDEPGAAEWTIRSSQRKWEGEAGWSSPTAETRLAVARYMELQGRHTTIIIRDGERRLAGLTCMVDGDTLIQTNIFRDEASGSLPTGVRVMHEAFDLAEARGLAKVDMGGGYSYKAGWAPEDGRRYDILTGPALAYQLRKAAAKLKR